MYSHLYKMQSMCVQKDLIVIRISMWGFSAEAEKDLKLSKPCSVFQWKCKWQKPQLKAEISRH